MASPTARLTFRLLLAFAVVLILFYVGRPLYWKISATIHDIRHNKQTVSGGFVTIIFLVFSVLPHVLAISLRNLTLGILFDGISQIVQEAQRSVGWFHDESDSGVREYKKSTSSRRFLLGQVL
ncbi:hypothetical protein DH2020_035835 [Rehmannia glutinosa]|uniref:Uncharacterized protein n=1 Tax=Rehmannia glutinosa TaxID=99300 RepID=A0ABR0V7I8_REHGL